MVRGVALYHLANLTVFPSLYEGFGFPVLESMACGTPVIAGNNSSLREVVGNNSLLLPDSDKETWIHEILHILSSADRQKRMIQSGLLQAKKFSWEKTAQETRCAYMKFAGIEVEPIHAREERYVVSGR